MRYLAALLLASIGISSSVHAQSRLLESVERNPEEAIALCKSFQKLNSDGLSATTDQAVKEISRKRNLTPLEAEILSTYVMAYHCPNVF